MADKTDTSAKTEKDTPLNMAAQFQEAGLGSMLGLSAAWMEALGEMGAEVAGFVADRIKEDVKTQHKVLHCKDVTELQQVQAEFIQRAMEQYQDETGKLVDLSTKVFTPESKGNGNKD